MVTPDNDGRFQLAARHQIVDRQTKFVSLAVTQPADACWQALKAHALLRQVDPAAEDFVVWKQLKHQLISAEDVRGLARERHPAEGPAAFADQRPNVRRHKPGKIISVLDA